MFSQEIVFLIFVCLSGAWCVVRWENIRCASDAQQDAEEGRVADIGRFPWLGLVQHSFYRGGKTRFAVTNGILVHPSYAIASAEDVARIPLEGMVNNTKFIVWRSSQEKYSMEIESYHLPPEYTQGLTMASLALLHISDTYGEESSRETGELGKEMYKMIYVETEECEEFYRLHQLNHKAMAPVRPLCATSAAQREVCVWDGGVALISRQSWGFWKLIGFSVRGPGCGAPARFLYIHDYLMWIDGVLSDAPPEQREDTTVLMYRRLSPVKLIMYSPRIRHPKQFGNCERRNRGWVIYKDASELLVNKNIAQGYFFLSVAQVAQMNCVLVLLDVGARTNAAIWVEHNCHPDLRGELRGMHFRDQRQKDCFMYFKSVSFVEFRFYFSFKATLEVALYGHEEDPRYLPNPFKAQPVTDLWLPTTVNLQSWSFVPLTAWWWYM